MVFRNKATGTLYNVTNEAVIPFYERDERFEAVAEKKPVEEAKPKTTKKK